MVPNKLVLELHGLHLAFWQLEPVLKHPFVWVRKPTGAKAFCSSKRKPYFLLVRAGAILEPPVRASFWPQAQIPSWPRFGRHFGAADGDALSPVGTTVKSWRWHANNRAHLWDPEPKSCNTDGQEPRGCPLPSSHGETRKRMILVVSCWLLQKWQIGWWGRPCLAGLAKVLTISILAAPNSSKLF
jgi:hypothetical protein